MNTEARKSTKRISSLPSSVAVLLICALAASLYTSLERYVTSDEPLWLPRYEAWARAPLEEHSPGLVGVANRILIGIPGHQLITRFGFGPYAAYRSVQIAFFFGIGALIAYLLLGLNPHVTRRQRCLFLPIAALPILTIPACLAFSRVINYDTVCCATMLLSVVLLARAVPPLLQLKSLSPEVSERPWLQSLAWIAAAGLVAGVSITAKGYGFMAAAYACAVLTFFSYSRGGWGAHFLRLALAEGVYASAAVTGAILGSPFLWASPWRVVDYFLIYPPLLGEENLLAAAARLGLFLGAAGLFSLSIAWSRRSDRLRQAVGRLPARTLALFGCGFLALVLFAVLHQELRLYYSMHYADTPVKSRTGEFYYSFDTPNRWTERAANLSFAARTITYLLPEHVLLMLLLGAGIHLYRTVRRKPPRHTEALLLMAGFPVFYLATSAYLTILPVARYLVPIVYGVAGAAIAIVALALPQRPRLSAAFVSGAVLSALLFALPGAPHYHGYVNLLRSRQAERTHEYKAWKSVWPGWGEGIDIALPWIEARHPGADAPNVAVDYSSKRTMPYPNVVRRAPIRACPTADYYIVTKIATMGSESTNALLTAVPPLKAFGYWGVHNVYVYDNAQVMSFLYGSILNPELPGAVLTDDLAIWDVELHNGEKGHLSFFATVFLGDIPDAQEAQLSGVVIQEEPRRRVGTFECRTPLQRMTAVGGYRATHRWEIDEPVTALRPISGEKYQLRLTLSLIDAQGHGIREATETTFWGKRY